MGPIEQFKYELSECDILEYAIFMHLSCTFGNPNGWFPEVGMDNLPNHDKLTPFQPTIDLFVNRYNNNKLSHYFKYDAYLKSKALQELLAEFDFDKDKFWYLLLFTYDFCDSVIENGRLVADSAYDQLCKFINTILPHVNHFDKLYGSTTDAEIELSLQVNGVKGSVKINSQTAIHFLAESCKKRIEEENLENEAWMQFRELKDRKVSRKESPKISYFANMLLRWFNSQKNVYLKRRKGAKHSIKERRLISHLIYFTRLSTNKNFLTDDDLLKSYLKQYNPSDFYNITSSIYPEFLLQ